MLYISLFLLGVLIALLWPNRRDRGTCDDEHGLYAGCESAGADPRVRAEGTVPDYGRGSVVDPGLSPCSGKAMKRWEEKENNKDLKRNYKGRRTENGKKKRI